MGLSGVLIENKAPWTLMQTCSIRSLSEEAWQPGELISTPTPQLWPWVHLSNDYTHIVKLVHLEGCPAF